MKSPSAARSIHVAAKGAARRTISLRSIACLLSAFYFTMYATRKPMPLLLLPTALEFRYEAVK